MEPLARNPKKFILWSTTLSGPILLFIFFVLMQWAERQGGSFAGMVTFNYLGPFVLISFILSLISTIYFIFTKEKKNIILRIFLWLLLIFVLSVLLLVIIAFPGLFSVYI